MMSPRVEVARTKPGASTTAGMTTHTVLPERVGPNTYRCRSHPSHTSMRWLHPTSMAACHGFGMTAPGLRSWNSDNVRGRTAGTTSRITLRGP